MCDRIVMPDGKEIDILDDKCLCGRGQKTLLTHIIQDIPELQINQKLEITRDPFGYVVCIVPAENTIHNPVTGTDYVKSTKKGTKRQIKGMW